MGTFVDVTMLGKLAFALLIAGSSGLELTQANFDDQVTNSGKNSLVKFLAPW